MKMKATKVNEVYSAQQRRGNNPPANLVDKRIERHQVNLRRVVQEMDLVTDVPLEFKEENKGLFVDYLL